MSETAERVAQAPRLGAFRGCLLGGAIGDALGYQIEFRMRGESEREFGIEAPDRLNFTGDALASISDHTQMTLFTAEGLILATLRGLARGIWHPSSVIAFALLRWYETQGGQVAATGVERGWLISQQRLHTKRSPGNTCMASLASLSRGGVAERLPTVERPPNNRKGCGAVMRVAPCGLGTSSIEEAFSLGRDSGVITHGHPSGYLSAAYFAALIWGLSRRRPLLDVMHHADELLANERGAEELQSLLVQTRSLAKQGVPNATVIESLGGGWTGGEALAIAMLCALTHDPDKPRAVQNTLWRAAAHSGDSGSTAAITGNLLGAMFGMRALPARWTDVLELRDVIDRVATDLYMVTIEHDEDVIGYSNE